MLIICYFALQFTQAQIILKSDIYFVNTYLLLCLSDTPTYSSILGGRVLQISAQSKISIPLTHTSVQMFIRPCHTTEQYQYCTEPIDWSTVKKPCDITEILTTCKTNQQNQFKICVSIRKDNYPPDTTQSLPGHMITILAPITVTNLLPHELIFNAGTEKVRIAPGASSELHSADINQDLEMTLEIDGFPGAGKV